MNMFDVTAKALHLLWKLKHKTGFGGIVTIVLMIVTLSAAIFFGQEIIRKKSPSVNLSTESYSNPEKIYMKIIWVYCRIAFRIDPRIFNVRGFLFSTIINSTGTFNSRKDVDIVPCSNEPLSKKINDKLQKYHLNNLFCTSKKQKFRFDELYINELFGHNNFQMIQIKLYECKNTAAQSNCEFKEEIEQFLNSTTMNSYHW